MYIKFLNMKACAYFGNIIRPVDIGGFLSRTPSKSIPQVEYLIIFAQKKCKRRIECAHANIHTNDHAGPNKIDNDDSMKSARSPNKPLRGKVGMFA